MIRLKVWLAFWLINACRLSVISNCLFSVAQLRTDTRSVSPAGVWILEMYEWVKSAGWDCISVTTLIYHSIVFGRLALIFSRHHWDNCPAFFFLVKHEKRLIWTRCRPIGRRLTGRHVEDAIGQWIMHAAWDCVGTTELFIMQIC